MTNKNQKENDEFVQDKAIIWPTVKLN